MLKELRTKANLTQKQAAELLGVPFRTYQDWEYGKRTPPKYVLKMVIDKLKKES
jgi:transcriptional regulator with XRE-family HTH domain